MQQVEVWLESIPSKQTKKSYRQALRKFEAWYQKPVESLLGKPEEATKAVERFFCWMKENQCQNSARSTTNAILQYLKAHDTPVQLRKALNVYKTVCTVRDHQLTIIEVQSMAKVADLREQLVLKIGLYGLRVGDASVLKWKTFDVSGELPIEIEIECHKEDTIARTFIDAELKEILEQYLNTIDKENPCLFQSKRQGNLSVHRLDEILKQLFERAGLKSQKILRWHCFRKLVLRTCAELSINQWSAKILVGKTVPADILTYISGLNLKEDYIKLSNVLKLKGNNGNGKVSKLEDALIDSQKRIATLETTNQVLTQKMTELEKKLESMADDLMTALDKALTKANIPHEVEGAEE